MGGSCSISSPKIPIGIQMATGKIILEEPSRKKIRPGPSDSSGKSKLFRFTRGPVFDPAPIGRRFLARVIDSGLCLFLAAVFEKLAVAPVLDYAEVKNIPPIASFAVCYWF